MKTIREVRVSDLIKYFALPFILLVSMWVLFGIFANMIPSLAFKLIFALIFLGGSCTVLKPFVIGCILMYKAFAPKSIRENCRFEPTCSTYMIMAINKYGLIKGVIKGIKRILRCKEPNGGIDYP